MTHKRGRKPNDYTTTWGEKISGLSQRKSKNRADRFYPVGKGAPCFGVDEARAVMLFRQWQKRNEPEPRVAAPFVIADGEFYGEVFGPTADTEIAVEGSVVVVESEYITKK